MTAVTEAINMTETSNQTLTEDTIRSSEQSPSIPSTPHLIKTEPKLWAGKYKTVEDLENAYKNSARVYDENQELKKQLERYTNVPDDYEVTNDIIMRKTELDELKQIAKTAGLNQDQFLKTAKDMQNRIQSQLEMFEKTKQELGEANLNVLSDYVSKNYPERLRDVVLNKLIQDKDAMSDALKHRESILNSSAPGIDVGNAGKPEKYDGQKDLAEAAKAYHKNPQDKKARERYIALAAEVGNERFKR